MTKKKDRAMDRESYGKGQRDKQMLDKLRAARRRRVGHVLRRDSEYILMEGC